MKDHFLHSASGGELPPPNSRHVWSAEREGWPQKLAVPGRCGIHLSSFLLLVEFDGQDTLRIRFAVPVSSNGGGMSREVPPGVELSRRIEMRGSVVLASDYTGCP
jgi:hypothetical protein